MLTARVQEKDCTAGQAGGDESTIGRIREGKNDAAHRLDPGGAPLFGGFPGVDDPRGAGVGDVAPIAGDGNRENLALGTAEGPDEAVICSGD